MAAGKESQGPTAGGSAARDIFEELRSIASAAGFVGCGAASRSSFDGVPEDADPSRVLSGYRALLVLAAPPALVTSSGPYGPVLLDAVSSEGLAKVRRSLEEAGYEARPVVSGDVSLPRAAAAAGLGEISPVGALVSREFGLSLTLAALVTDAPLCASRPGRASEEEQRGRSDGICTGCGRCVEDCPATLPGAFDLSWCTGCGACVAVCRPGRGAYGEPSGSACP